MQLDLRRNGRLTVKQSKHISNIEKSVRLEYNHYITEIARINSTTGLDWLNRVLCRNTHLSLLLEAFCRIRLLEYVLASDNRIKTILVDSKAMKTVCTRVVNSKGSAVNVVANDLVKFDFSLARNIVKSCYMIINLFIWPKLIMGKTTPTGPVVYLDTFLFIDSFDTLGKYQDRYYPGLSDCIDDKEKVWYAPTLIGFIFPQQFWRIFKSIRSCSKQFLMKEDWLTIKDYLKAIIYSYRIPENIKHIPVWNTLDIKELVQEEIRKDKFSMALINPILIYLFIKRLKMAKVDLEVVVDWNENQVIDRALVLGVKEFYPGVKVNGYQGYIVPDFYTCKDPTEIECLSGTVPDEIYVIGKQFVEGKKQYCHSLNVSVAPAFRFSNIHKINLNERKPSNEILVILPISLEESNEIILMCIQLIQRIGSQYRFYIKQHPSYTRERILSLFPNIKHSSLHFVNRSLHQHLLSANLLISASSSVCIEAALMGVSVAIVGSRSGPAMNPLETLTELKNWRVCYGVTDIEYLLSEKNTQDMPVLENYFYPVNCEKVSALLSTN